MSFDVEPIHLKELLARFAEAPTIVGPELERAGDEALNAVTPDLAHYPPPPGGSTYQRTGTLGDGWTTAQHEIAVAASGFEAKLQNPTPYGPYVQGDDQAPVHQGRWKVADQILSSDTPAIEQRFDEALTRIADQLGGS